MTGITSFYNHQVFNLNLNSQNKMKIDKKAINYYHSFFEVSKDLNQKQFYDFNMAIYKVLFFEIHIDEVSFKDQMLNILWKSVKHSIQASVKGYCDKKSIPYDECFDPLANPLSNNIKDKNNEEEKGQCIISKGFQKPSLDDIRKRCSDMKYNIDYEHFYNYYESNGWKVGRNKMKSWHSALANWNKNNSTKTQNNMSFKQQDKEQRDREFEAISQRNIFDVIDEMETYPNEPVQGVICE